MQLTYPYGIEQSNRCGFWSTMHISRQKYTARWHVLFRPRFAMHLQQRALRLSAGVVRAGYTDAMLACLHTSFHCTDTMFPVSSPTSLALLAFARLQLDVCTRVTNLAGRCTHTHIAEEWPSCLRHSTCIARYLMASPAARTCCNYVYTKYGGIASACFGDANL